MGNCFNRNTEAFVKDEEMEHHHADQKGGNERLNTLMVMAEEEKKTNCGRGGLPNLVSLAEQESKNMKSPVKSSSVKSPIHKYEEMLSSPTNSPTTSKTEDQEEDEQTDTTMPEIKISLAAFNPEESNLFDSDKVHLVMIDEFSEEEVHDEEEGDSNNNIVLLKRDLGEIEVKQAPLAIADC